MNITNFGGKFESHPVRQAHEGNLGLTDYLAIYGAGLSTAVAVWNYFRARSKIRVLLIFAIDTIEGETQSGIGISIQNPSAQIAHITHVSFLYRIGASKLRDHVRHLCEFKRLPRTLGWCHSGLSLHGVEDGCPVSVEPGKSHWIFVHHDVLEGLFENTRSRELRVGVQDALWRNKYSKVFEYPSRVKDTELVTGEASQVAAAWTNSR